MIWRMPKRLLLVDDEEFFLQSLKDGLELMSDIFITDICFSVNEAIKHVVTNNYDLLITDIRMPGKSGIDLLIYLRDMKFKGKVMVMSAYNTVQTNKQIKFLGAVEVISKPFKLEWFKNMLLERFGETGKPNAVNFETIDLVTVMQIIHMERKTSALEIDIEGIKGTIYFVEGEIVHAEYNGLEGETAILKLITLNSGVISVKKTTGEVKQTVEVPFVQYMMNIMKTIDEVKRDRALKENTPPSPPLDPPEDVPGNTESVEFTNGPDLRVETQSINEDTPPLSLPDSLPEDDLDDFQDQDDPDDLDTEDLALELTSDMEESNPNNNRRPSEMQPDNQTDHEIEFETSIENETETEQPHQSKELEKNETLTQYETKGNSKEVSVAIEEILKTLSDVKGYLGSGVFTPQGELLEGTADISGIQFEQAGSLIHDALSDSRKMTKEIGFGKLDMLQLYTEMGIIFAVCHDEADMHFHTILVIKTDGNIAMAKLKLKKAVKALTMVF